MEIQWCLWSVPRQVPFLPVLFESTFCQRKHRSAHFSLEAFTYGCLHTCISAICILSFFLSLAKSVIFSYLASRFFLFLELLAHTNLPLLKIPTFLEAQDVLLIFIFNLAFVVSHSIMTFLKECTIF